MDNNQGNQPPVADPMTPPIVPVPGSDVPAEPAMPGDGGTIPVMPTEAPANEPAPAMPGDGGTTTPPTGM